MPKFVFQIPCQVRTADGKLENDTMLQLAIDEADREAAEQEFLKRLGRTVGCESALSDFADHFDPADAVSPPDFDDHFDPADAVSPPDLSETTPPDEPAV